MSLHLDYTEVSSGFQVGRVAALAEWSNERERRAFEKLCARLYNAKWASANRGRRRDQARRFYARHAATLCEKSRAARRRKSEAKATTLTYRCAAVDCDATWGRAVAAHGPPKIWCSKACYCRMRRWARAAAAGVPFRRGGKRAPRPLPRRHLVTLDGVTRSLAAWAKALGVDYATVWQRVSRLGWSPERALRQSNRRKLTKADHEAILRRRSNGEGASAIARAYGIAPCTVSTIVRRRAAR